MSGIRWMVNVYGATELTRHGLAWGDGIGAHQVSSRPYSVYGAGPESFPVGQVRLFDSHVCSIQLTPNQDAQVREFVAQLEAGILKGKPAHDRYNEIMSQFGRGNPVEVGWSPLVSK